MYLTKAKKCKEGPRRSLKAASVKKLLGLETAKELFLQDGKWIVKGKNGYTSAISCLSNCAMILNDFPHQA